MWIPSLLIPAPAWPVSGLDVGKSFVCHSPTRSSFAGGESSATTEGLIQQRDVYVCCHLNSLPMLVNKLHIFLEEVIFCHCTFKCQAPGEESSR